jgi:hypothetical protein
MDFTLMLELTPMTDPKLEEEIGLVKGCLESLKRFHDIFDNAVLTETVVPEDEGNLQELRATLPMHYDSLLERLGLRRDNLIEQIVEMANSLSAVILLTDFQRRKLYDVWHRTYMRLSFLLGRLQYRKERLEALRGGGLKTRRFLTSPFFLILLVVIIVVVFVAVRVIVFSP